MPIRCASKRDAFAGNYEAGTKLGGGEMIANLAKPAYTFESRQPHERIAIPVVHPHWPSLSAQCFAGISSEDRIIRALATWRCREGLRR
jgi:hypothetical protein